MTLTNLTVMSNLLFVLILGPDIRLAITGLLVLWLYLLNNKKTEMKLKANMTILQVLIETAGEVGLVKLV